MPKNDVAKEQYLVGIVDVSEGMDAFYVVVPSRKDLVNMMQLLSSKKYVVGELRVLQKLKSYDSFLEELVTNDKPEGLNFGKDQ